MVHARKVDLGDEGDLRGDVGVVLSTADLQAVNSILVYALEFDQRLVKCFDGQGVGYMRGSEDGAVPVGHEEIVAIIQTV